MRAGGALALIAYQSWGLLFDKRLCLLVHVARRQVAHIKRLVNLLLLQNLLLLHQMLLLLRHHAWTSPLLFFINVVLVVC